MKTRVKYFVTVGCSENFRKSQRKNSKDFTSASKKEPLHR